MNAYDFDMTIFTGDTEDYFFAYLFRKKGFFWYRLNYELHEFLCRHKIIDKTAARQADYKILRAIDDIDAVLEGFWNEHETYMMDWYDGVKRQDDLIATGTPRFLIEPIVKRLGLSNLIATDMDPKTGKIKGRFLGAQLKADAFQAQFPGQTIEIFYSDTYSDHFLADISKEAYIVHDGCVRTPWKVYFEQHPKAKNIPYIY